MKVGTLVKWVIDDGSCYGMLGVVCKVTHNAITIQWVDGLLLDYVYQKDFDEFVEVLPE
tara:strand:+ start:127 stop:303 length:177 start_codon:yes stop_codon:yes gene_type:complete